MIGHPHEAALLRFLDGSGADLERKRVAHHLADCQRCRDLVQGHRRVRQALVPVAASAPPALLDRVLATRAAGEGVILPVDVEPGPRREWRIPFSTRRVALGVLAASAVLAVGVVVVELLPRLPIAAARAETAKAFDRLLEGLGNPRPGGPQLPRPDAPPAIIHPERMRELTATYEARHYDADRKLIAVDSQTRISVRRRGDQWLVEERAREVDRFRDRNDRPVIRTSIRRNLSELSASDLRVQATHGEFRFEEPGESVQQTWQQILGDSLIVFRNWYFNPSRPTRPMLVDDTTIYRITTPTTMPSKGYRLDGAILFLTVDLSRWWAGSFERYSRQQLGRTRYTAEASTQSFRVVGSARADLPIGRTDAWVVEYWSEHYLLEGYRELYRKSDGLLAAILPGGVESDYTELRLLSVTYP